jgi:Ca2+/H+ antiporter
MIGQPMTLYFDNFETAILFTTVLVVNVLLPGILVTVVPDSGWAE